MVADALKQKAQAATEYIIIAGFVFFSMIVAIALLQKYGTDTFEDITDEQLRQTCLDIVDMSESVYFMGAPARQTKEFTFPQGIRNITLLRNDPLTTGCTLCTELRFSVYRGGQQQFVTCSTNIIINSTITNRAITTGLKKVRVESLGKSVFINWTS